MSTDGTFDNISKKEKISETNSLTSENSENLEARYFDIFNKNRPVLESEQHKGKSHLYIYQTASDNYVSSLNINTLTGLKHKMFPTKELALSKVELVENLHKLDFNKPTKKPIFIDNSMVEKTILDFGYNSFFQV